MKFGRLYQLELAGTPDWPRLRYKQLKKLIKSRLASHEITSIFQTGHFKKIIREDLQSINAFWLRQEKELLDRERATEELPYLRQQQEEQVTSAHTSVSGELASLSAPVQSTSSALWTL
mmetsp:Transcript_36620/g.118102  ORF Transcript_36620/g.118102 Transcript_36620/m.118102 type:complete len:119 (+) Transcript_36620:112-468(+)